MKIAVTATGPDLDSAVDSRFGRCACFIVTDPETSAFDAVDNDSNVASGAGVQAAQTVIDHGVTTVLTGNCGPKAQRILDAAGVTVILGVEGSVREAIDQYRAHGPVATDGPVATKTA